jgi:hypothetical protein
MYPTDTNPEDGKAQSERAKAEKAHSDRAKAEFIRQNSLVVFVSVVRFDLYP